MEKNETARENVTLRKRLARLEAQLAKLKTAGVPVSAQKTRSLSEDASRLTAPLEAGQAREDWFALFPESNPNPVVRVTREGHSLPYRAIALDGTERNAAIAALILTYGTPAERLGAGPAFRLVPLEE
jgi:hypothetical protein